MPTIMEILNRITTLDIHHIVQTTLSENRELILDLNRNQMMQGKKADNSDTTPQYTRSTRLKKIEQGENPDIVSLYDTGDFQRNIYANIRNDNIEIDSTDNKTDLLKTKYGEEILGLSNDSREQYIRETYPAFKNKIQTVLKLQIK